MTDASIGLLSTAVQAGSSVTVTHPPTPVIYHSAMTLDNNNIINNSISHTANNKKRASAVLNGGNNSVITDNKSYGFSNNNRGGVYTGSLLSRVLKYRQLQGASQLFTVSDYEIITELHSTLFRIKAIFNEPDYARNTNDQSCVELVLSRVTAALREASCIETYAPALVDLLESCLAHKMMSSPHCRRANASPTGISAAPDNPYSKIASEVLSTLFLYHSKQSVMTLAIPVAVKAALASGNASLTRNTTSYLALAAIHNARILAQYSIQIITNIVHVYNLSLIRVLPQLYPENREPFHAYLTPLFRILRDPAAEVSEKLCLLQLASMVANTKPELIVPYLPEFDDFLLSDTTCAAVLHIYLTLLSSSTSSNTTLGAAQLHALRVAASASPTMSLSRATQSNNLATMAKIVGVVGRRAADPSTARAAAADLLALCRAADTAGLPVMMRELEDVAEQHPRALDAAQLEALRTVCDDASVSAGHRRQSSAATRAAYTRISALASGGRSLEFTNDSPSNQRRSSTPNRLSPHNNSNNADKLSHSNLFDAISGRFIDDTASEDATSRLGAGSHPSLLPSDPTPPQPSHNNNVAQQQQNQRMLLLPAVVGSRKRNSLIESLQHSSQSRRNSQLLPPPLEQQQKNGGTGPACMSHRAPALTVMRPSPERASLLRTPVQIGRDGRVRPVSGYKATVGQNNHPIGYTNYSPLFANWLAHSVAEPPQPPFETVTTFPVNGSAEVLETRPLPRHASGSATRLCVDEHQSVKQRAASTTASGGGGGRTSRASTGHYQSQGQLGGQEYRSQHHLHPVAGGDNEAPICCCSQEAECCKDFPASSSSLAGNSTGCDGKTLNDDVVRQFVENRRASIRRYIAELTLKYPIPRHCTVVDTGSARLRRKLRVLVHFACEAADTRCCVFDAQLDNVLTFKTKIPAVWLHLMFLRLEVRSIDVTGRVLCQQSAQFRALDGCWRRLPKGVTGGRSFSTLVTSAFPSVKEQSAMLKELHSARYHSTFSMDASTARWICFSCAQPQRLKTLLNMDESGRPLLEGRLKQKRLAATTTLAVPKSAEAAATTTTTTTGSRFGTLFRRWHTKYFTLSGASLTVFDAETTQNSVRDRILQPSIDLRKIRSVRSVGAALDASDAVGDCDAITDGGIGGGSGVVPSFVSRRRRARKSLARAFEIHTDDDGTFLLKAPDRRSADEWRQSLQIAVAQAQRERQQQKQRNAKVNRVPGEPPTSIMSGDGARPRRLDGPNQKFTGRF